MKHSLYLPLLCLLSLPFTLFTAFNGYPMPSKIQVVKEWNGDNRAFMDAIGKEPSPQREDKTNWVKDWVTPREKQMKSIVASKEINNKTIAAVKKLTGEKPTPEMSHELPDLLLRKLNTERKISTIEETVEEYLNDQARYKKFEEECQKKEEKRIAELAQKREKWETEQYSEMYNEWEKQQK